MRWLAELVLLGTLVVLAMTAVLESQRLWLTIGGTVSVLMAVAVLACALAELHGWRRRGREWLAMFEVGQGLAKLQANPLDDPEVKAMRERKRMERDLDEAARVKRAEQLRGEQ